jgi:hypothetical protein
MRDCGALAAAEKLRDDHASGAASAIAPLADTPAKKTLLALNEWARTRGF